MNKRGTPEWIFCAGMMRSGSTLQYQLAAELVERRGLGRRLGYAAEADFPRVRRAADAGTSGCKVFKAHTCTAEMQSLFGEGRACALYIFRDLRDVALSLMRKYTFTFEDLLAARWLDQVVADGEEWTRLPGVLVSCYEKTVGDLREEVERIAAHLGIAISPAACLELAAAHDLERQREHVRKIQRRKAAEDPQGALFFDERTLLHHDHIRSGAVGEWRRVFTLAQTALLEDRFKGWLLARGYALTSEAGQEKERAA